MGKKVLGLDLGTGSLGWAILDEDALMCAPSGTYAPNVIESGVVIFPEGMERDKSGSLKSRAAERRSARAARRLIFRRKWRKMLLLKKLIELKMCPMSLESLERWKKGHYPIHDEAFRAWLAATPEKNPYVDRKRAAEERVDLLTLGRALYHLAQRRGFKSSRKEQLRELVENDDGDDKRGKKRGGSATDKELGVVRQSIADLTVKMGGRTLGQYFYDLFQAGEKIRGTYVWRVEHYQREFDRIMEVQQLATDDVSCFRKILFFQRRLRSQSHLVGWCELEKERTRRYRRCVVSHPDYEAYAAWGFVNNMRVGNYEDGTIRPLTNEERMAAFELLKRRTTMTGEDLLKGLRKKFKDLPSGMSHRQDVSVPIMPVTKQFSDLDLPEKEWQTAFNALTDFDDLDKLRQWAQKRYNWDEKNALKFIKTNPSEDRGRYSLHAIRKILPWLKEGYLNHTAVFLAKLPEVIADFDAHREEILAGLKHEESLYREEKKRFEEARDFRVKIPSLVEGHWKYYLSQRWGLTEEGFSKLYVDQSECDVNNPKLAPVDLGSYRNPLVCRSLTILRRLVNQLRAKGKIDAQTRIHVELAHQTNSSNECRAIEMYQKDREHERAKAESELRTILDEYGINVQISDNLILRYLLWQEQGGRSVYTGQPISAEEMVAACDIEHTVPRSVGGTNRMENLTLCEAHYNRSIKKNLLPSECPNATQAWHDDVTKITYPALDLSTVILAWRDKLKSLDKKLKNRPRRGDDVAAYNRHRQTWLKTKMERDYLSAKLGYFSIMREKVSSGGFMPRQLVDTGAMTRRAIDYLKTRYPHVYPTNGTTTAYARRAWGLQKETKKDRSDHTHHALDAMVIAALSRESFANICAFYKGRDTADFEMTIPPPYPHFGEHVHHALDNILVRHLRENRLTSPHNPKAKRSGIRLATPVRTMDSVTQIRQTVTTVMAKGSTVRGCLHDATIYGRITLPGTDQQVTVVRKTLASAANGGDLRKWAIAAADPTVGKLLLEQIEAYCAAGIADKDLPSQVYWMNQSKGIRLQKVRVKMSKPANPTPLRPQVFPGTTDEKQNVYISNIPSLEMRGWKNEKGKWETACINLLAVAKGTAACGAELSRPNEFALAPGQFVLTYEYSQDELRTLSSAELSKRLYVIVQTFGKNHAIFKYHREARPGTVLRNVLPLMKDADTNKTLNASGESTINYKHPNPLLLLSVSTFGEHMLFEGRDFVFTLDGKIEFVNQ